jgi:triphosphoribosyl-dephospho-CoA synthase
LAQDLASLAAQSLIYEVSRFPAPGLVSPVSNGAHRDMNYYTFVDSVGALTKYFVLIAAAGYSNQSEEEIFLTIREIGKEAERAMFLKTQGVNTHKGAIFLLGLSLAAVAKTLYTRGSFLDVPSIIRAMTRDLISSDLDRTKLLQKTQPTHGEKIWLDHNISGIRAEAQAGFPTVFDRALPVYENSKDLSQNDRLVNALIEIMGHCQDTTIVHRHSPEVLFEVREKASKIMAAGGTRTLTGRAMIEALQNEFISRNISPGGSADLLGLTVFLSLVKN